MAGPAPISYPDQVFDLAFHPTQDIVAASLITGGVHCHKYATPTDDEPNPINTELFVSHHHKKSCRAIGFSVDGASLFTASGDKSLQVVNTATGKVVLKRPKAHDEPLNALRTLNETLLASGDDGGCVKIWDTRQRKVAMKYKENVDFISDMEFVEHKKTLVVASGDGCLSIFDIRKSKPVAVSANQDDELLSVAVVRNTTKAVVGTQSGTLLFFSWADWGDCTDRFPGHPSSIDSIAKLDETTILTASSDGIIRSIGIMPNRLVGVCGEHGEMPVERIRLSRDGEWVGSCGHDQMVRFWSVDGIERVDEDEEGDDSEEGDEEEGDEEEDEEVYSDAEEPQEGNGENGEGENDSDADSEDASSIPKPAAPTAPAAAKRAKANSSDDSDDSDAEKKKKKKKRKKAKRGIAGAKKGKSFFAGLD